MPNSEFLWRLSIVLDFDQITKDPTVLISAKYFIYNDE